MYTHTYIYIYCVYIYMFVYTCINSPTYLSIKRNTILFDFIATLLSKFYSYFSNKNQTVFKDLLRTEICLCLCMKYSERGMSLCL